MPSLTPQLRSTVPASGYRSVQLPFSHGAAARDIVSQTTIADPTAAALPAPTGETLARRMLRAAGLGVALWVAQLLLALLDPAFGLSGADWSGVSALRPDLLLASFGLTVLLPVFCALRRDAAMRPFSAAWIGVGLALVHLLLLIGLPQGAGARAGIWAGFERIGAPGRAGEAEKV